jgi:cytoskeletal protein CcmA (bactofilin family)
MLWERKPVSPRPEIEQPDSVPVNVGQPTAGRTDSVGLLPGSPGSGRTVLGRSAVLKGELSVQEDLVIEGQFEGNLAVQDQCVTIGPEATVKSDIRAREAIVLGAVEGNIFAQQRIEIRKTGRAVGNLIAPGVVIECGAYFKGRIEILNHEQKEQAG